MNFYFLYHFIHGLSDNTEIDLNATHSADSLHTANQDVDNSIIAGTETTNKSPASAVRIRKSKRQRRTIARFNTLRRSREKENLSLLRAKAEWARKKGVRFGYLRRSNERKRTTLYKC